MTSVFGGTGVTRSQAAGIAYPAATLRSGQRVGLPVGLANVNNAAIVANTMYAWPILIPAAGTLSGVAVQVGTPVAGVSGKLGIALPGANGFPETLLAECPGAVDMNSAADQELVASFASSLPRPPEMLWGLCVFNGLAQPMTVGAFTSSGNFLGHFLGNTHIGGYTGRGTSSAVRVSRAHTYADAFPATLSGWSVATANPSSPVMVAVAA